jgi:hypothetical protein
MKVYKYRGGSDAIMQRDLTAVAENFFWAPTADQLNDPTEAYVNTRMIEDVLSFPAAKDVRFAYDQLAGMRHKVGIYSLSRTPLDELMWAHYANSHTGFCIEYDLDRLILEARTMWDVVDVAYHEEPQTLVLEDIASGQDPLTILEKMVGTKSLRWGNEKEIRIITTESGANHYAPGALTGVYFGCRCNSSFIDATRRRLAGRSLTYFTLSFRPGSYQLEPRQLEYDADIDGPPAVHLAPVDDGAVPDPSYMGDREHLHEYIPKAIEIVRRDPSCRRVLYADVSVNTGPNEPVRVYVCYETNVPTKLDNAVKQYFTLDEIAGQYGQFA